MVTMTLIQFLSFDVILTIALFYNLSKDVDSE